MREESSSFAFEGFQKHHNQLWEGLTGNRPFYQKLVTVSELQLINKRAGDKTVENRRELKNLETKEQELWAAATESDLREWAKNSAGDNPGQTEEYVQIATEIQQRAVAALSGKDESAHQTFKDTMEYLNSKDFKALGEDLQNAAKFDKKFDPTKE